MASKAAARPHCVAVVGGAVSGAEVAGRLSQKGITVAVFEQNPRPYGKIEDGLPRWHHKQREKEYRTIFGQLSRENVYYVPNTRIGRDVDFDDLCNHWGFSAVVLANGAWRDRPVGIEGADDYVGKGLIYQNPFLLWWNHLEEQGYRGPTYELVDDTIVLGGGLASIDVAKIVMLENARAKLAERGIEIDIITLEVKGIPKILESHGLRLEDLGLKGCTIYYRRRITDMPVATIPDGASPEREAKVRNSRKRLLDKAMRKFCFGVEELSVADDLIVEGGRLVGMVFRRTRLEGSRVVSTDETYERRAACVISSIGSIPEPITGIKMKGELYDFEDWDMGRLSEYPNVFSVGNVVTGKGNIVASRRHAEHVTVEAIEGFLGVSDDVEKAREALRDPQEQVAHATAESVVDHLETQPQPTHEAYEATLARISERQKSVAYTGELDSWLALVTPKPR
ncbi:MAG: hypothetical protein GY944_19750 [bacterium]|nr:hypothetical protein [bacterium]